MTVAELSVRMTSREVGEWRALELLAMEDDKRAKMDADAATGVEEIGIAIERWEDIVTAAFVGERGRNFVGDKTSFGAAAKSLELV